MDQALISGVGLMTVSVVFGLSFLYALTGSRIALVRQVGAALGVVAALYASALGLALVADNWSGGLRAAGTVVVALCAVAVVSACGVVHRGLTVRRG